MVSDVMSNSALKPPKPLDFTDSNLSAKWKPWKEEISLYIELALVGKNDDYKRKTLLYLLGDKGREIYRTLPIVTAEADRTVAMVIAAFDTFCLPKQNETLERYHFFTCCQKGENFEQYLTTLRTLATTCNFGDLKNSLIRDRIVCGIENPTTREKLLREEDLDLDKCIALCKAVECTENAVKEFATPQVSKISSNFHKKHSNHRYCERQPSTSMSDSYRPDTSDSRHSNVKRCKFCSRQHELKKRLCPAFGKVCSQCGELNHFASCCDTVPRFNKERRQQKKNVRYLNESSDSNSDSDSDTMYNHVRAVHSNGSTKHKIFAKMMVEKTVLIKFQLDSGATCNIIPLSKLPDKAKSKINPKKSCILHMYNNATEVTKGEVVLKMINPKTNDKFKVTFSVIDDSDTKCVPIIGASAAQAMNLIQVNYENILKLSNRYSTSNTKLSRECVLKDFGDVFAKTQGRLPGVCKLFVDTTVRPVVQPPRRVPVKIKDQLLKELNRLEDTGIISKQNEPSDWVSSLVCVTKKSGALRICIDPKPLNTALKRNHYPMRTIEDILPDLGKMKVFSTFDARNGYWHVKLDKESSLLTCFNTPYGKYVWNVLPMGIKPASEEYQKRQDDALTGLKNVYCIADDILVAGEGDTIEEATANHDTNVRDFLQRCREKNLRLNADKMKLNEESVSFIGHKLTREGLRMDPEKISAITDMPAPTDITGVRRLLGMVNYLSKFLPSMSDMCRPIRMLTLNSAEFQWNHEHEEAFENLKSKITSDPVLQYFNPAVPIVIQCDASSKVGLGCCLLQRNLPVCYASRALTETETRYSIMELELLAILFAVKKFHQYIFGSDVEIHTDHRPLQAIFDKPIHSSPKRLQRMLIHLQNYNLKIVYKPGSTMHIADTLSRAVNPANTNMHPCEKAILEINLLKHVPISNRKLGEIQKHTELELKTLKETIMKGWPEYKEDLCDTIKPYYSLKGELTVYDGIILKGDRVVIPPTMRSDVLRQLHSTHIGVDACVRRSRECVYWPGIAAEIRDFLSHCDICNTYGDKNQKEPLKPRELATRPWEKVSIDLCSIDQHEYLICVDHFSNFTEIELVPDQTAESVICKLKLTFARHGIPDECYSDQAAIFTGVKFKRFSERWAFDHIMSSPTHSQSNGKAENAVKTMKRLILKCKMAGTDPYLAILEFRNTPSQYTNTSPTQRLFNRKTKTLLPTTQSALKFKPLDHEKEGTDKMSEVERMKFYYDRNAKPLPKLNAGDLVRIQPERFQKAWRPGRVTNVSSSGRSYDVQTPQGAIHRNRVHLRKSAEPGTTATTSLADGDRVSSPTPPVQSETPPVQSETLSKNDETPPVTMPTQHTRTRTIRPPQRYDDYIRH